MVSTERVIRSRPSILTFAAADNEVFRSSTECASNDVGALLLPSKATDHIGRLDIDELYLALREVHQHVLRVTTDIDGCGLALQGDRVFLLVGLEIVNMDLPAHICGNQSFPIRGYGAVLNSVASRPHIQCMTTHTPMAELRVQIERASNKRLSVCCPGSCRHRLAVLANCEKATPSLRI